MCRAFSSLTQPCAYRKDSSQLENISLNLHLSCIPAKRYLMESLAKLIGYDGLNLSMTSWRSPLARFCLLLSLTLISAPLLSASLVFSGSFVNDDEVRTFFFQVPTESIVQVKSLGYAGGTTSTGVTVSSGGFDTFFTLFFFPRAHLLSTNDDGPDALIDLTTGQGLDSLIERDLAPGSYLVVLSQFGNFPIGLDLTAGFSQTGNPTFTETPTFAPGDPCPTSRFKDSTGSLGRCRNGKYTVEISGASPITDTFLELGSPPTSAPEPCMLFVVLIMGFFIVCRATYIARVNDRSTLGVMRKRSDRAFPQCLGGDYRYSPAGPSKLSR